MANSVITLPYASATALALPPDITRARWRAIGEQLHTIERATGWWIGDWWNAYKPVWGDRAKEFDDDWKGPSYSTCRHAGAACIVFDIGRRRPHLSYSHHAEAALLGDRVKAEAILDRIEQQHTETGTLPPKRMVRQEVKRIRRAEKEVGLAEASKAASAALGKKVYGVIYADPPWRFEPYSRVTGMDRAADNHYPTLTTEQIISLPPDAADDCVLFLWATPAMLLDAIDVMLAWGFAYRSQFVWVKPHPGTGYWVRSRHELLLIGIRGEVPAPAPGEQYDSVIEFPAGEHSAKPNVFAEMIEDMFPNADGLEMYARGVRFGWDVWGNEAMIAAASESAAA